MNFREVLTIYKRGKQMNLTKKQLKRIIKEELSLLNEQEQEQEQGQGEKQISDVAVILKYLPKIDTKKEYAQLISAIIKHAQNVPNVKPVLVALKKELQGIIEEA